MAPAVRRAALQAPEATLPAVMAAVAQLAEAPRVEWVVSAELVERGEAAPRVD